MTGFELDRVMQQGRPSQTAVLMAALRAYHYVNSTAPRILDDSLAMSFAGLASPAEVNVFLERVVQRLQGEGDRCDAQAWAQRLTMLGCTRARLVEDQLAASASRGMRQLVILGAGLDSLAYRRPDLTAGLAVFEVDYPATQAWKRDKLATLGTPIPANVRFVPIDFEHGTLAEALKAGGVQLGEMTLFSWLGVQMYLADTTVMATLDLIAGFPSGSELVMDCLAPDRSEPAAMLDSKRKLLAQAGESFKSVYEPEVFRARLEARGFTQIDIVSLANWLQRHRARWQGRFSAAPGSSHLVAAQVA